MLLQYNLSLMQSTIQFYPDSIKLQARGERQGVSREQKGGSYFILD